MTRAVPWMVALSLSLSSAAWADTSVYSQAQSVETLGTQMGASLSTAINDAEQVVTNANLISLGTALNALEASVQPANTIDGVTYTEVYSFGLRVFSDAATVQATDAGLLIGLAPTEVRVPLVIYPVYGIAMEIDGGARFQANVTLSNASVISIPLEYSQPGVLLSGTATAAGFVEGYANAYLVRAGIGAQLDLLDANMNVDITSNLDGSAPTVVVSAMASFLNGTIYAFLDAFDIFSFTGYKRLLSYNLYQRYGYCFAQGALSCPTNSAN